MSRLDLQCIEAADSLQQSFVKKDEKLLADAAAVLAAQGLYAFSVYLTARSKKDPAKDNAKNLLMASGTLIHFLDPKQLGAPTEIGAVVSLIKDIAADLQKLLLAKRMVAEMLTYLKYHLKAKGDSK